MLVKVCLESHQMHRMQRYAEKNGSSFPSVIVFSCSLPPAQLRHLAAEETRNDARFASFVFVFAAERDQNGEANPVKHIWIRGTQTDELASA